MYSNSKIKKNKYLGFSRILQRVAHSAGMPQEAYLDIYYYFLKNYKKYIIVYVKMLPRGLRGFSITF